MNGSRILVGLILAATSITASASASEPDVVVGLEQACPAGTVSKSLSYRWENGRFVRDGRVCESLYGKN